MGRVGAGISKVSWRDTVHYLIDREEGRGRGG
jgi:hypothetical protein